MSFLSAIGTRRSASLLLLMIAIATALLAVPAVASVAAPYPPTTCSASAGNSLTGGSCSGVASTSAARTTSPAQHGTDSTASTGFQALTATAIAGALLAGGVAFVLLGRRRRHG